MNINTNIGVGGGTFPPKIDFSNRANNTGNQKEQVQAERQETANPQQQVQNNALESTAATEEIEQTEQPETENTGTGDNYKNVQNEQKFVQGTSKTESIFIKSTEPEPSNQVAEQKNFEQKQISKIEEQSARNAVKGLNTAPGPIVTGTVNGPSQLGSRLDTSI